MNDEDLDHRLGTTLAAHRDATEARRAAGLVAAPVPPLSGRPAEGRRPWAPPGSRPWLFAGMAAAAVVVAVLAGIAALRGGPLEDGQRIDAAATTLPPDVPSDSTTTSTLGTGGSPTTSVVSPGPDRSAALWFRNHYEGLADDAGTIYRHRAEVDYSGPMVRTSDGGIYVVQDQRLFLLAPGQVEPEPVDVDGPVGYVVDLDSDGQVVWLDGQNTLRRLDGGPAASGPAASGPAADRTAANGWTARLQPAPDPATGLVEHATDPAELEILDPSGTVARTFTVGGASASDVKLEDFDGRRVIVSRAPAEPAGSPWQMLLIDLACDPVCVRTSIGVGDTVLNGPDIAGDPPLATPADGARPSAPFPLDLCPTEGSPAPDPPAGLSALAGETYRALALGLTTCDPFTFQAATADATVDWSLLQAALSSPPVQTSTDGQPAQTAWTFTDPASERWLSIDASGVWTSYQATGAGG